MNVSLPRGTRDLVVAAAAASLLVPLGLWVAAASPAEPAAPAASAPSSAAAPAAREPEAGPPPPPLVVGAAPAAFGVRLADGAGRTLYTFSGDARNASRCTGRCAAVWQPVRSSGGKPQPGSGIEASMVGSLQRADGSDQVSFGGRPLYRYSGDSRPGTSAGRGLSSFGGDWSTDPDQPALPAAPAGR